MRDWREQLLWRGEIYCRIRAEIPRTRVNPHGYTWQVRLINKGVVLQTEAPPSELFETLEAALEAGTRFAIEQADRLNESASG